MVLCTDILVLYPRPICTNFAPLKVMDIALLPPTSAQSLSPYLTLASVDQMLLILSLGTMPGGKMPPYPLYRGEKSTRKG